MSYGYFKIKNVIYKSNSVISCTNFDNLISDQNTSSILCFDESDCSGNEITKQK